MRSRFMLYSRFSIRSWLMLLLASGLASNGLFAQLPVARLSSVFPPGGQRGATLEVTISGADLDEVTQLHFSHAGIGAQPKLVENALRPEASAFVVAIGTNVPYGVYEARAVGRYGSSNPRAFTVGHWPETIEKGSNNSASSAHEIKLNAVLNGRVEANAMDYFKFAAKRGQRILIRCLTREIDSRMDAVLILSDGVGREIDRNRRGGLLDYTVAADGQYALKIHDFLYRGGEEYFYRLALSTEPHLDFIFPAAGLAGSKGKYGLFGRNLPGGVPTDLTHQGKRLEKLEVEIELPGEPEQQPRLATSTLIRPADSVLDGVEYRLPTSEGASNPEFIGFATAPVVTEQEPNDSPAVAQQVSLPCEYAGQFYPRGDQDWIQFQAGKGDIYWVEVFSHRLGLPTDPFVLVQKVSKGDSGAETVSDLQELYDSDANIGGPEYNTLHRDLAWRFDVKETATYRIQVRDLFNRTESNPALIYRLSLRKEVPDFRLVALAQPPPPVNKDKREAFPWSVFLRRGETVPVKVLVFRRDNFNGEIALTIEGLPPGVRQAAARIDGGKNSGVVFLTASESAKTWVGPIRVVGKAKLGEKEVVREARGGSVTWTVPDYNNEPVPSRMIRDFVLAVSEKEQAPVLVYVLEDKPLEISVAGKLQIPVQWAQTGEFKGNVKLKAAGVTALDAMKEVEIKGQTNRANLELDLAQYKLSPGIHQVYLLAQSQGKYRKLTPDETKEAESAVQAAEESAKKAEKVAEESAAAVKQAEQLVAAASKAADEAQAAAKAASEKLASTKSSADKAPQNEENIAARNAAEKEAAEASAKASAAAEAKIVAEKTAGEAAAKAKEAGLAKDRAVRRAKALKESMQKVQPKDATVTAFSVPVALKVVSAPITISADSAAAQLEPGKKTEIPVNISRLYGFAESVELSLVLPKNLKGINAAKISIPKDQTQAKLVIETTPEATPGDHKATIQAALKFNNQELKADHPITLKLLAAGKPKS